MDIKGIEKKLNIIPNGYVGSKKQKIAWIHQCLQNEKINIRSSNIFDAFSGAGSFSYYAKSIGARSVISNDFLISSALYVKTFVENPGIVLSEDEIQYLIHNKNKRQKLFIQENYVGKNKYFHNEEAIFLDNYRANVDDLSEEKIKLKPYPTISLRKNLTDINNNEIFKIGYKKAAALTAILSMISSWFGGGAGKFSSPSYRSREIFTKSRVNAKRKDRPFIGKDLVLDYLKYSKSSLDKVRRCIEECNDVECITLNTDTLSLLQNHIFLTYSIDVIYVDLPYGGEQSDYIKLYGLLESYILNKCTSELKELNNINYFNSPKKYEAAFIRLAESIKLNRIKRWVFSFNDSSWAPINNVVNILRNFCKEVKIYKSLHHYRYRKRNNREGNEFLIICK